MINTARGAVVDHAALVEALASGRLGGYAADVWDPEPPTGAIPAAIADRLLLTPHVAAITDTTYRELCVRTVEAALEVLRPGETRPQPMGENRTVRTCFRPSVARGQSYSDSNWSA